MNKNVTLFAALSMLAAGEDPGYFSAGKRIPAPEKHPSPMFTQPIKLSKKAKAKLKRKQ